MDHTQRERLSALVEELTTSGEPQLNPSKMKDVKKICKTSSDYIDHFYHLIMRQLAQEHAEIRFSALQMVNELFSRSHHFRTLLVSNFQGFLELTVETDPEQPLPPPREVARKLKILAIRTVEEWQASYGEAYKKLALGYHFLKQIKKVDFHDVQARTQAERKRQEEKQKRLERLYKDKVDKATKEMEESFQEIQESLTEIHSCLKLLAPHPVEFNLGDLEPAVASQTEQSTGPEHRGKATASAVDEEQPCCSKDLGSIRDEDEAEEENSEEDSDMEELPEEDAFIRHTGLMSYKYSLDLDLSADLKVKESEENEAVVNTVRDLHRLINTKHLPAVRSWVQVFTKAGVDQQLLRRAVDLRTSLEEALRRHDELHIEYRERERRVMKAAAEGEEDEDDFEEVPEKEGFEPHIPDHLRAEYGLEPLASSSSSSSSSLLKSVPAPGPAPPQMSKRRISEEEQDPTCAAATLRVLRERFPSARLSSGPCGNGKEMPSEERGKAPVVPFGLDLYYWGEEQPTAGKIIKNTSQHQFWVPHEVEEEVENEELSAQAKSRFITFSGSFQPVKHKCGAPMSNGSLCERQDRVKCPFHGPIIPRDELGRPRNPEDAARLEQERMRREEEQPGDGNSRTSDTNG
ncbi:UV-stimulated scaffold protein A isoform X2 [Scleropages formosus]|uniref:UV-stimulated scaffold protein A isoform X2 n=1 Tax=Scleropages formosus TaxID=113540 RepID=UPI000878539B|nr:UV-stimulated scaffold protein A isoform X2 [Scleropages formosus]